MVASSPVFFLPARGPTKLQSDQGNHMRYVPFPDPAPRTLQRTDFLWSGPVAGAPAEAPGCHPPGLHASHSGKTGGTATDTTVKHDRNIPAASSHGVRHSNLSGGSAEGTGDRVGVASGTLQGASAARSVERRGRLGRISRLEPTRGRRYPGSSSRACWLANRRFRA